MAFKINTQPYQIRYPQATPSTSINKPSTEPIKQTINTGKTTTTPQIKYPSHNLLSKYNSAGSYYNFQNSLNNQLGIKNKPTNYNTDEGQQALIENLQQQSNAFNYGLNSGSSAMGWSDALGQYLGLDDIALQKSCKSSRENKRKAIF